MDKPTLLVRNRDLEQVAEIDDYTSLTVTSTLNDVGAWTLELSGESPKVALLDPRRNPGGGIVVLRDGVVLFSGPVRSFAWQQSPNSGPGSVTVAGPDDNVALADCVVWPSPGRDITQQGDFYQHAAGDAETVMRDLVDANGGPASLSGRAVRGLVLQPANQHRGRVHVPGKMRFGTVLEELQREAAASQTGDDRTSQLGFRVVQVDGALQFQVFVSADRVRYATFGFELGNLAGASYTLTGPTANAVILGAGATSTDSGARIATQLREQDRADTIWPYRVERFADVGEINLDPASASYADDSQRLADTAGQALDDGAGQTGVSLQPIDTEMLRFGRDYALGDWVTVVTPYTPVQERVVQVGLTWTAEDGEAFAAGIGTKDGTIVSPSSRRGDRVQQTAALARIQQLWQRRRTRQPYWTTDVRIPTRRSVR